MTTMYFVTHPEVIIDPSLPISLWDYSERGAARLEKILKKIWIKSVDAIYSSNEPRATKAAQTIADQLGYRLHVLEELGDVDRSSTGFVPQEEFTKLMEEFYAHPDTSVRGWEKATDAQTRVHNGIRKILTLSPTANHIALVSHTILANLLMCTMRNIAIAQLEDVPQTFSFEVEPDGKSQNWISLDL